MSALTTRHHNGLAYLIAVIRNQRDAEKLAPHPAKPGWLKLDILRALAEKEMPLFPEHRGYK